MKKDLRLGGITIRFVEFVLGVKEDLDLEIIISKSIEFFLEIMDGFILGSKHAVERRKRNI